MEDASDIPQLVLQPGVKRKADGTPVKIVPRRIEAISLDVVSKIAAGEVVVAPAHALKELIENSIDAGATTIDIIVKEGGLKLMQITDNGHGINKDDLAILCDRFTTSKLKSFEDLTSIGTYGFRGEALASISHVAHLSVTTKTQQSSCAWKACYADGKLVPTKPGQSPDPKPTAGKQGTQITVEDLFYNTPTRRKSFRSSSDEYAKILDLVGRYSIHCANVAFSCKKYGDGNMAITVPASASIMDRVRHVHNSTVIGELVELKASSTTLGFKATGQMTNANYSAKKTTFLLFINHRSVESTPMKKAIEQTFATFLPKGGHPFVYLSLEIEPHRVDVNVHPTKREVRFLHEDEITNVICSDIQETLSHVDSSRTFMTQTLLPGTAALNNITMSPSTQSNTAHIVENAFKTPARRVPASQKPYENNLIRTDSRSRKITSMLNLSQQHPGTMFSEVADGGAMDYVAEDKDACTYRYESLNELRAEVCDAVHSDLTDVFASHTFVGIVDSQKRIAAVQGGVKLYLIDYAMVCNEYFYQVGLTDFGNFGTIKLATPISLRDLLKLGADAIQRQEGNPDGQDWDQIIELVIKTLVSKRAMLEEYFNVAISEEGMLLGIPLLIKGYMPCLAKLPQFLIRLGPAVDWTDEKKCFHSFLRELASFYTPESTITPTNHGTSPDHGETTPTETERDAIARRKHIISALEDVLFPAFKARLVATKGLLRSVVEIASLKGLYHTFERC